MKKADERLCLESIAASLPWQATYDWLNAFFIAVKQGTGGQKHL